MTRGKTGVFIAIALLCAAVSGGYAASTESGLKIWAIKGTETAVPVPGAPSYDKASANDMEFPQAFLDALPKTRDANAKPESHYDTLARVFEKGTLPKIEDATGWYAGRMFYPDKPDKQIASLLTGYKTEDPPGGLFPVTFKIGLWFAGDKQPADYYDHLSTGAVVSILSDIKKWDSATTPVEITKTGLVGGLVLDGKTAYFEVRKYEKFLIVKNGDDNPIYHYYFKDVTPSAKQLAETDGGN
jgi:hypothetical protein